MKLWAIHHIDRDPSADPPRVAAGKIFDATEAEVKALLPIRAARAATAEEIALAKVKGEMPESAAEAEAKAAAEAEAKAAAVDRTGLEARAKELNVKFNANLSDEKLAERVAEAEAKAAAEASAAGDDTLV